MVWGYGADRWEFGRAVHGAREVHRSHPFVSGLEPVSDLDQDVAQGLVPRSELSVRQGGSQRHFRSSQRRFRGITRALDAFRTGLSGVYTEG